MAWMNTPYVLLLKITNYHLLSRIQCGPSFSEQQLNLIQNCMCKGVHGGLRGKILLEHGKVMPHVRATKLPWWAQPLQNADGVGLRHEDDATSIALPSGHAASTSASPYFTFFTNVISCHGSMADREKYKKEIAISAVKVVDDEDVSKRYEIVTYQTHQRAICTDMWGPCIGKASSLVQHLDIYS